MSSQNIRKTGSLIWSAVVLAVSLVSGVEQVAAQEARQDSLQGSIAEVAITQALSAFPKTAQQIHEQAQDFIYTARLKGMSPIVKREVLVNKLRRAKVYIEAQPMMVPNFVVTAPLSEIEAVLNSSGRTEETIARAAQLVEHWDSLVTHR